MRKVIVKMIFYLSQSLITWKVKNYHLVWKSGLLRNEKAWNSVLVLCEMSWFPIFLFHNVSWAQEWDLKRSKLSHYHYLRLALIDIDFTLFVIMTLIKLLWTLTIALECKLYNCRYELRIGTYWLYRLYRKSILQSRLLLCKVLAFTTSSLPLPLLSI